MGEKTGISWTNHTWNPWRGCQKVSPGCKNCYMFRDMKRYGMDPSVVTLAKHGTFMAPRKWNQLAAQNGKPEFVFTCSWSDFFIPEADKWRNWAWAVMRETPYLLYQVLTKRPENILDRLPSDWYDYPHGYPNVGIGVSVESAAYSHRVTKLTQVTCQTRFISAEPLLGSLAELDLEGVHWLIAGGESEPSTDRRREMDLDWARELRDLCATSGVAFFYKQGSATIPGQYPMLDGKFHEAFPEYWTNYHPCPNVRRQ